MVQLRLGWWVLPAVKLVGCLAIVLAHAVLRFGVRTGGKRT